MEFQVKLTDEAATNYAHILAYLEEKFGAKATSDFKQRFRECAGLLAENPHLFPVYLEDREIRRAVLIKEVSVYYRIKEPVIQILTIHNN